MNFASEYVYDYEDSEEEMFDDDELYTPMSTRDYAESAAPRARAAVLASSGVPMSASLSAPPPPPAALSAPTELENDAAPASAPVRQPSFMQRLANRVRGIQNPEPSEHRARREAERAQFRTQYAAFHQGRVHAGRRADTNVVAIRFNTLTEPSHMHTGDVVNCCSCGSTLSHFSRLKTTSDAKSDSGSQTLWSCEFCGTDNPVDIDVEEIPKTDDVTYMLSPAPATAASSAAEAGASGVVDQSIIVFCVDVSGSMCVTTEVAGSFRLRGRSNSRPGHVDGDSYDQHLPHERRDVTYISRLQAMQAAVDAQLTTIKEQYPDRRIALIAFNNEVKVVGTTGHEEVNITGDKLNDKDTLIRLGSGVAKPGSAKDVATELVDKLFQLEEDGATALGPALLVSIALAGQEAGSKVVVCTDGLANVGIGNLEDITPDSPDKMKSAQEFYDQCGELAKDKGVSVSVVTIEGNRCRTLELGSVADATGGAIDTVDPLHLTERFGSILSNPVIATNVTAKLLLHSKLYVRFTERPDDHTLSYVEQYIGNVTKETEVTFEYGIKRDKTDTEKKDGKAKKGPSTVAEESISASSEAAKKETTGDTTADAKADATAEAAAEVPVEATTAATAETPKEEPGQAQASEEASPAAACADAAACAPKPIAPPAMTVDGNECYPFQLVIKYTSREGAESLRVLTQAKPITKSRDVAERDIRYDVVGANSAQVSARCVMEGEYTSARSSNLHVQRLLQRRSGQNETSRERYGRFVENMEALDVQVLQAQSREMTTHGRTYSDTEDVDSGSDMSDDSMAGETAGTPIGAAPADTAGAAAAQAPAAAASGGAKKGKKLKKKIKSKKSSRKVECEDEAANMAYKMKAASTNMFS